MIADLRDYPADPLLRCDVCVVGAGAAGITLTRALAGSGLTLCLVESGGLDFAADTQALAEGENAGDAYYDLVDSRLRFFGGSTNIWGGRCVALAPEDFRARPWVPGSGWPLTYTELAPWYACAAQDLELGPDCGTPDAWCDPAAAELGLAAGGFASARWRFDELAERFNARRCADLFAHRDVTVLLHANLCHIQATPGANAVQALDFAALSGRRARIVAEVCVLACGGIENARLLLAARDVEPAGIGNRHDQVGRCFMEHPHARAGVLDARAGYALWARFQRRYPPGEVPIAPVLVPSAALQHELGVLNTALTFKLQRDPRHGLSLRKRLYSQLKHQLAPSRGGRRLWHVYRGLRKTIQRRLRRPVERLRHALGVTRAHVMVRAEQAPNPDSRVRLGTARDALGMPLTVLEWRLSALDKLSVLRLAERLDATLRLAGHGRLERAAWLHEAGAAWPVDPTVGNHAIAGYHHMGTTRMSSDPTRGVVDADCRVHGYANLYIAGSSVFPTSGWANPTLTIIALAHRLAAHLRIVVPRHSC